MFFLKKCLCQNNSRQCYKKICNWKRKKNQNTKTKGEWEKNWKTNYNQEWNCEENWEKGWNW